MSIIDQGIIIPIIGAPGGIGADASWIVIGAAGAPGFLNGWAAGSATFGAPRFRKVTSTLVVVQGYLVSGVGGTTAWLMPVGYRPTAQPIMAIPSGALGTSADNCKVLPTGEIQPQGGGANGDLINFSYVAEQ